MRKQRTNAIEMIGGPWDGIMLQREGLPLRLSRDGITWILLTTPSGEIGTYTLDETKTPNVWIWHRDEVPDAD